MPEQLKKTRMVVCVCGGGCLFCWCCRFLRQPRSQIWPNCEGFGRSAWMCSYSSRKDTMLCQFCWRQYFKAFLPVWKALFKREGAHRSVLCQVVWVLLVFNSSGKILGSAKALSWQDWCNPSRCSSTSDLQNEMCHPAFFGWYLCLWGPVDMKCATNVLR